MNYNEACEKAEDKIRDDLSVGAVSEYVDGDSALEYLGQILAIHQRKQGNAVEVDAEVGDRLQLIIDHIVENNVFRVADEESRK